jgi:hypothetical protein
MCLRRDLCLALLGCLLAGCASGVAVQSSAFLEALRPSHGPTGPDIVDIEVALIEAPVGDHYLNQELWTLADDQVVAIERQGLLEDNGFRVGQVGGIPPAELQERLTSQRNCVDSRRFRLHAGTSTPMSLGNTIPRCHFQVHQSADPEAASFEQVDCSLLVVPSLTADGKTRLTLTPQIQSGKPEKFYGVAPGRTGWVVEDQRPTVQYAALGWEVSLDVNEYVIIGARLDRPETLGHVFFVRGNQPAPRQLLLVVRTSRVLSGVESAEDLKPADQDTGQSPPLALRASQTPIPTGPR